MPTMTAPELRRKRADRVFEFMRLSDEATKDGAIPTPEQSAEMDRIFAEIEVGGLFDRQIRAAEQFAAAEGLEAQGRESAGRTTDPLPHEDPTNTRRGHHRFSLIKAFREASNRDHPYQLTGLEAEVSKELYNRRMASGRKPEGIMLPNNLPVDTYAARRWAAYVGAGPESYADLDTNAGSGSIPLKLGTMIDILRARMVTVAMGATVMEDMQGLFALPRQATPTTVSWVTQGQSVSRSTPTIDQVPFSPHTCGAQTLYTRQFLEQTSVSAENFVRQDQAAQIARGIETAALNGTGSGGQPLGLLQNPLIPTIAAGTNGAVPTWDTIVNLETTVAAANADMGSLGYVLDAAVRGLLKRTVKAGTFPVYLWDVASATPLNGYKAMVTNLLPNNLTHGTGTNLHAAIFGDWDDLIYAYWSGMDVVVDPYTAAGSGGVIITTLQDCDVNVEHPESFAKMGDLVVT